MLARKAGASEENREIALGELRKMRGIDALLTRALSTDERPFALEVIGDLGLKSYIPQLLKLTQTDPDGFIVLAINSLMEDSSREQILKVYLDSLDHAKNLSPGSIVAMLEPLGRLGSRLSGAQLSQLKSSRSPEVRDALLYYLRIMSRRHGYTESGAILDSFSHDSSLPVREHAKAVLAEFKLRPPARAR